MILQTASWKTIIGGIQKNINPNTIAPYIEQAELAYIQPYIGREFYDELAQAVISQTPPDESTVLGQLIKKLNMATAYFTYYKALPFLSVSTGDSGVMLNTPGNTAAMPKWLYLKLEDETLAMADANLESALQYLEANKAEFGTWTGSSQFTISHDLFIQSASQLGQFFPASRSSRQFYVLIREYIKRTEAFIVKPFISPELYLELKNKIKTATPNLLPEEAKVCDLIGYWLAHETIIEALAYLPIVIFSDGIRVISKSGLSADSSRNEEAADNGRLSTLKADCISKAAGFKAELQKYLDTTSSSSILSSYFNSATKASTEKKFYDLPENLPESPYFLL
jgi:hypothetical protein